MTFKKGDRSSLEIQRKGGNTGIKYFSAMSPAKRRALAKRAAQRSAEVRREKKRLRLQKELEQMK